MSDVIRKTSPQIKNELQILQRKLLLTPEAHTVVKDTIYSPEKQDGFIHFGVASNNRVVEKTLEYMPSYLDQKCCGYEQFRGSLYLRQYFSKNTGYTPNETAVINGLSGIIDMLSENKRVYYSGKMPEFDNILDHSKGKRVGLQQSQMNFIEVKNKKELEEHLNENISTQTVFILPNRECIVYQQSDKVIYAFEHEFDLGFKAGVILCRDANLLKYMELATSFHTISSLFGVTVQALQGSEKNREEENKWIGSLRKQSPKHKSLMKMLQLDSNYVPQDCNFYTGIGTTALIYYMGSSLFKKGDVIGIDSPFYYCYVCDFAKAQIQFSFQDIKQGKLIDRVKKSFQAGEKGFIIVNPHNPTGQIYQNQQIEEVCQWGVKHPEYILFFDQIYRRSPHSKNMVVPTTISYADKYENFVMSRGFSKDFGLCGFRYGYMITCNKKLRKDFNKWDSIIRPQPYVANAIDLILQASNYGQDIIEYNQDCLMGAKKLVLSCLKKEGIEVLLEPKGGVFLMMDLSPYLEAHPEETEHSVWKSLFYDYRVAICRGKDFEAPKLGYYRVCYLLDNASIEEGIRRIGMFLRGEKMWFNQ